MVDHDILSKMNWGFPILKVFFMLSIDN